MTLLVAVGSAAAMVSIVRLQQEPGLLAVVGKNHAGGVADVYDPLEPR
jgi:hypothetical protein